MNYSSDCRTTGITGRPGLVGSEPTRVSPGANKRVHKLDTVCKEGVAVLRHEFWACSGLKCTEMGLFDYTLLFARPVSPNRWWSARFEPCLRVFLQCPPTLYARYLQIHLVRIWFL